MDLYLITDFKIRSLDNIIGTVLTYALPVVTCTLLQ